MGVLYKWGFLKSGFSKKNICENPRLLDLPLEGWKNNGKVKKIKKNQRKTNKQREGQPQGPQGAQPSLCLLVFLWLALIFLTCSLFSSPRKNPKNYQEPSTDRTVLNREPSMNRRGC